MAAMDKTERRQVLLRAARDVFATKGYHDAKVDDIVALAKVAKGTFYLYFPDKRSLFSELVDVLFRRMGAAILRVDVAHDVDGQIKHNIRAIVAVLLDDPALTNILLSHATGMDPAFVSKIQSFYDGVKQLLADSLKDGQRLGIVAEGDTALFATFTVGALKELLAENVTAPRDREPMAREDIVEALFRFLQGGYLRTNPPPAPTPEPRPRAAKKR